MMRTATLASILAVMCAAPAVLAAQDQKKKDPPAESQKVAIPGVPGTAQSVKTPVVGADPTKMAAPAGGPKEVNAPPDYLIGPEDVLNIVVWNNAQLSSQAMVRPDGKVTVALIGDIIATGKTPEGLAQEIRDKLKEGGYILTPQVQVGMAAINSKKFYINGQVRKPGTYNLVVPMRVLEALVNTGGFDDFANTKDIRIVRGDKQFKFNYNKVIKGQNKDQNIFLQPGDIIIVK